MRRRAAAEVRLAGRFSAAIGGALENAAVVGRVGSRALVPLRIEVLARQALELGFRRRQFEMQAEAGARLLRHADEADLVLVVGGFFRVVLVVVIDAAIEVEELGPGQDRFELVQDQAVLARGLIGGLARGLARLVVLLRRLGAAGGVGVVVAIELGTRVERAKIDPQRHRLRTADIRAGR